MSGTPDRLDPAAWAGYRWTHVPDAHPPRLLIVSNRLPVSVEVDDDGLHLSPSAGGLATGLRTPHERSGGLWIGWPGDTSALDDAQRDELGHRITALRAVPVWLDAEEVKRFYEGFSNEVLWPLFHYRIDQIPIDVEDWGVYERVNRRFAETIAAHYQPGDLVWVHDYQLMLVPHMLRQLVPEVRIGFFLHIPFPSSEVFRTLPFREQLLEGLLGADLVGFHTPDYMRHFASSLLRTFGLAADIDHVRVGDRAVAFGAFPMGIDAAAIVALAAEPRTALEVGTLRGSDGCAILVGIDRLDYTKGIPRRLLSFEHLLRDRPELRERVRLIQVAVPSRTNVEAYQEFRQQVEALVGRVNGAFGTPSWTPIQYLYRSLSEADVVALYRAADVMVVTPVRDGMNLVAKEFVAARTDDDGVLVLSEFAGAASELAEALHVNPFDVGRTAEALHRALTMSPAERGTRMRGLRRRVLTYDVHRWVRSFLESLEEVSAAREPAALAPTPRRDVEAVVQRMRRAERLILVLSYDGALVPYASVPELAAPDAALLDLLRALAARRGTVLHVLSGRPRDSVERWLGTLPIGLHAEHGFWSRDGAGEQWVSRPVPETTWRARVHAILEHFAERTPGSLIEEKTASLAWHYRMAEPAFGERQAIELRLHLTELLSNAPVEIITGEKVVEVRPHGISESAVVARLVEAAAPGTLLAVLGADRDDEELFAVLPDDGIAIHVGPQPSRAPVRLAGVEDARRLLAALLDVPG
jgi:trehalose 6-phosphate synthase/phosphatase